MPASVSEFQLGAHLGQPTVKDHDWLQPTAPPVDVVLQDGTGICQVVDVEHPLKLRLADLEALGQSDVGLVDAWSKL